MTDKVNVKHLILFFIFSGAFGAFAFEDLSTPHNCRIVVRATMKSKVRQVRVFPYFVKDEKECRSCQKIHKLNSDRRVASKDVEYIWAGSGK